MRYGTLKQRQHPGNKTVDHHAWFVTFISHDSREAMATGFLLDSREYFVVGGMDKQRRIHMNTGGLLRLDAFVALTAETCKGIIV